MDYSAKFPVYLSSFLHKIITDYVLDDFKNSKNKFLDELKEKTEIINIMLNRKIHIKNEKGYYYTSDLGCGEYFYYRIKNTRCKEWHFQFFYFPDDLVELNKRTVKIDTKYNVATNKCYQDI